MKFSLSLKGLWDRESTKYSNSLIKEKYNKVLQNYLNVINQNVMFRFIKLLHPKEYISDIMSTVFKLIDISVTVEDDFVAFVI